MMKSIAAAMLVASAVANPLGSYLESKPAYFEAKPMMEFAEAKPLEWSSGAFESKPVLGGYSMVNAPIMSATHTLPIIELSPIVSTYEVPSSTFSQENIKQPITQPVLQPYLQRYVRQPQPVVQPIVNRVLQPVVHRQLHANLQTAHEQAPASAPIFKPTQFTMSRNEPIVGNDLPSVAPIKLGGKSHSS